MNRLDIQRGAEPQIVADVQMYETINGGKTKPGAPGWSCVVMVSNAEPCQGWDALPLLRDQPIHPGESRRLGFVFLSPDNAVKAIKEAGCFYLWEGRFVGEATIIANGN